MPFFAFVHQHAVAPDLAHLQPYPFEKRGHRYAAVSPALCGPLGAFSVIELSIGGRSEATDGAIVKDICVTSMGVYIGQSTKIHMPVDTQTRARTAINDLLRD